MGFSQPSFPNPGANASPQADPRLQPTPDYGTMGPGSDFKGVEGDPPQNAQPTASLRSAQVLVAVIGMFAGLFAVALRNANVPSSQFRKLLSPANAPAAIEGSRQLDNMEPQKQAEALLEQAVRRSAVALDQISTHVDRWNGQVQWTPQIASLTTAALNSDDLRVRESAVEVELAAYGLGKNSASLDYVLKMVDSPDHARKVWGLWAAGLLANRGVEAEHIIGILTIHLKDEDVDSRRWAVEALALTGADASVQLLLLTMHHDPSPAVRERAACGIAASGLFTPEQRMGAVPRLISYIEDPLLDGQTQGWAFQALGDITHQHFGNDTAAWRHWYDTEVGNAKWSVTAQ